MRRFLLFTLPALFVLLGCRQPSGSVVASKTIIATDAAPKAIGPYSQAVKVGDMLYCAGQIGIDPQTGALVSDDIAAETRQVLRNIGAVLHAAEMDYRDVVSATVFLSDLNNYQQVNQVYGEFFAEAPPARAAVQVARLPKDANVEIMCIAQKTH